MVFLILIIKEVIILKKAFIRHDNLRKIMDKLELDITLENMENFLSELKHSTLILAANITCEPFSFAAVDIDGDTFGFLFTDIHEFEKFIDDDCESHMLDFQAYKIFVDEDIVDGFILNPESEAFFLDSDLFSLFDETPEYEFNPFEGYSTSQLKDLKKSIDNHDLEDFISDYFNYENYLGLFEKISSSTLLTLMLSWDNLERYARDGVISMEKTGPLGFLYLDEIGGKYATVFTSEDKISNVNTTLNKYSQIVNFSNLVNFTIKDDLDGIIINPNSEHLILPRYILLRYFEILNQVCNDERLNTAIMHMFLIETDA